MKKFIICFLFIFHYGFAQNSIYKNDKSVIAMDSITLHQTKKEVAYFVNGKENLLPYSELDSAKIGGKFLKKFNLKKKTKALYVLAVDNGKTMAIITKIIKKSRGGFDSYLKQYEIVVIENNAVIENLKLTASKKDTETQKRKSFFDLVSKYFPNCKGFMDKIALYNHTEDAQGLIILEYLDNPIYNYCK